MRPGPLIWLAWYLFKRLVLRLLRRERGLLRFEAGYCREDGLHPVAEDERRILVAASRCLACGACDAAFSAYEDTARTEMRGPSDLVLSYSRSLPDYDALHRYLRNLRRGDLTALSRVCPARVPFEELASLAEQRAGVLAPPPDPATAGTRRLPDAAAGPRRRHDPG